MSIQNLKKAVNEFSGNSDNSQTIDSFSVLGDYINKIDPTANRYYSEDGFMPGKHSRQREIITQEPEMTVLIKKRMFSSLIENFKPELMDIKEKLFYRASKKLFANKCNAISAYERLSKIDRAIAKGQNSDLMFPVVLGAVDTLNSFGVNVFSGKTQSVLEEIKKVKYLSDPSYFTTWINSTQLPNSDLGNGTGVIEFTTVTSGNTTSSVNFGAGSASLTFEDPLKLMCITEYDIERAIRESAGGFLNNPFFQMTESSLEDTINQLRIQLNDLRLKRNATSIRFLIDENSLLFKKVRAIIDEEGREILFNYDGGLSGIGANAEIDQSAFEGANGLADKEIDIFKQVLKNIYILMGLKKTTATNTFQYNKDTNYVRRKMMLHFNGKPIIQPMDVVHVFMKTNTSTDFNMMIPTNTSQDSLGLSQSLNNAVNSLNNVIGNISGNPNSYDITEKNAIAGEEFPMWLWNILKNDFISQNAGTSVFCGLINKASHKSGASSGKYILTASASDNCAYLKQGQININPSVDVWNSALYDPLTPRELDFDISSGFLKDEEAPLLQENRLLLNSGVLKFKNGRFRGYPANEQIYNSFDIERMRNASSVRRKYEDPDGFIYRWKEGIQSLTYMGAPHPSGEFPTDRSPSLNKNPFSGQGVMNILSLLVTGVPYNFNTFMSASIKSGALTRDDLLNESGAKSFYKGLLSDITKQNSTWGNFIPFKKLVINESAYNFLRSGQFDITTSNQKISKLLTERAQKFDMLAKSAPAFANNPQYLNVDTNGNLVNASAIAGAINATLSNPISDVTAIKKLAADIMQLDLQISQATLAFENSITSSNLNTNGGITIFGDDVSFDPTINQGQNALSPDDVIKQREQFRKKINYLTQRRLWKVKANEDQNLFIVDDSYDKNYDIQAFEKSLGNLELFKSTYTDPAQQVTMVAEILGLEVFADTQGHIQARPPAYNRMPSSIFYDMIQKKQFTGVQIFPAYLESLFLNQIKGLTDQIEIAEDEIRLRAAALGYITDSSTKQMLQGSSGNSSFAFVTNENDGTIGGKDIRVMLGQINPDLTTDDKNSSLKSIGNAINDLGNIIQSSVNTNVNFDIVQRVNVVNNFQTTSESDVNSRINTIAMRLQSKTGQPAASKLSLLPNLTDAGLTGISQVDAFNVTNQIAQFVSSRQTNLLMLSNSIKNLGDGIDLNTTTDSGMTALLPIINKNKSFPEIIEHMIEDESIDDLGINSGKRYIIKDSQIIDFSIEEVPPAHTLIEVTGLFGEGLAEPSNDFNVNGGNFITSAWAVDFDMWRMYGFKPPQTVNAPYLSDPDTQCAPFANFLLNKARKEIFQSEATIHLNEFIQPGEVYYIEDRNLLFYAESVSHSFSYGSECSTSISFKYGHNPGEYIPTILDIVGKGLYTNKNQAALSRNNRIGHSGDGQYITSLVYDNKAGDKDPLVEGSYGDQNRKCLSTILLAATGALTPTLLGKKATLEIRTYYNSKSGSQSYTPLTDVANNIKDWLLNPNKFSTEQNKIIPDASVDEINNIQIPPDSIEVVSIDLGSTEDVRGPSSGAFNKAREVSSSGNFSDIENSADPIKNCLFTRIIDVWITFSNQTSNTSIKKTPTLTPSQSSQNNLNQAIAALNAKIGV